MKFIKSNWLSVTSLLVIIFIGTFLACTKSESRTAPYDINNSLTLFKIDNINNDKDLLPSDTVTSQSGVQGKYIPISGNTGAVAGLGKVVFSLFNDSDSLLNKQEITSFYKPEYHVFNTQLDIPKTERGKSYKIIVASYDVNGTEIGKKTFHGLDVMTCDPLPPCIISNQITIMLETPIGTPEEEPIYIFGSINGWSKRDDPQYMFHKNPEMPNCYCLSIAFPPGYTDWQLTEIFVSRGSWANQAVTLTDGDITWDYTTTERGPIWKIKVDKWRDK